jgi:hypothetical protein
MPAVGPYSRAFTEMGMDVGLGKDPSISSSTSGAPCPRLAHMWGWSMKPCSLACSVHLLFFSIPRPEEQGCQYQITPVLARFGSSPAWGLWAAWERNLTCCGDNISVVHTSIH